ncbi:hypothetical protein QQF64_030286 [Cirrhinus molitorella]|uniref:Uncharacterized protein n=1 Tax=Cirrhinus molitorella TaxID=172907 RepID=A0ABR3N382_9TELE
MSESVSANAKKDLRHSDFITNAHTNTHALDLVQLVAMESSGMETERRRDCTYCNRHNSNTWFMLREFI